MATALGDRRLFPRFQLLVSLRALPSQPHLVQVGEVQLVTSWNGGATARVYVPTDLLERPDDALPLPALSQLLCSGGVCTLPLLGAAVADGYSIVFDVVEQCTRSSNTSGEWP